MTRPTRPAPVRRRAALAALGLACLALLAPGCSVARRRAWHAHNRGPFDDHRTAVTESQVIRGVAPQKGWIW
jgi:hypothetical protein